MSDIETKRQLAKQLSEAAKKLEEEADEKEALEAAHVPDSFDDFASFFQSDFKWQVVDPNNQSWDLKAVPLTEAAKKCMDSLLNEDAHGLYEVIRNCTGIHDFYRDSASTLVYFSGFKAFFERLPNLKLVVSKEGREIVEQWFRDERGRLEEVRKNLQEKQEALNGIELLDGEE